VWTPTAVTRRPPAGTAEERGSIPAAPEAAVTGACSRAPSKAAVIIETRPAGVTVALTPAVAAAPVRYQADSRSPLRVFTAS
jgi:hypothetical protein